MSARRSDRGQATVELALCLPVVVMLALGLFQVALVVRDQIAVDLAAREAARRAAVAADPRAAGIGGVRDVLGGRHDVDVDVVVGAHTVRVSVSTGATTVPIIGAIVADRRLSGTVTMALEPWPASSAEVPAASADDPASPETGAAPALYAHRSWISSPARTSSGPHPSWRSAASSTSARSRCCTIGSAERFSSIRAPPSPSISTA